MQISILILINCEFSACGRDLHLRLIFCPWFVSPRHFNLEHTVKPLYFGVHLSGFWFRMLNSGLISHHSRLLNANHVEPSALLHCDTPHQQGLEQKATKKKATKKATK
jgi:hypothetical protein